MECWSTEVATIKATNVTESSTKPTPHTMPISKVAKLNSSPESKRLALELLEKANVLRKELVRPDLLPGLLGNPQ